MLIEENSEKQEEGIQQIWEHLEKQLPSDLAALQVKFSFHRGEVSHSFASIIAGRKKR